MTSKFHTWNGVLAISNPSGLDFNNANVSFLMPE